MAYAYPSSPSWSVRSTSKICGLAAILTPGVHVTDASEPTLDKPDVNELESDDADELKVSSSSDGHAKRISEMTESSGLVDET